MHWCNKNSSLFYYCIIVTLRSRGMSEQKAYTSQLWKPVVIDQRTGEPTVKIYCVILECLITNAKQKICGERDVIIITTIFKSTITMKQNLIGLEEIPNNDIK